METKTKKEITITRMLNAPRGTVFHAWINPAQLADWWGPRGFTNPVCEADARPGGAIRIDMTDPDGNVYPMRGTFHEIKEPGFIVFTSTAFADEKGHPRLEVYNTVTFEDVHGKTRLTLHAEVKKAAAGINDAVEGMYEGWSQSLDKLETLVAMPEL